MTGKKKKGESWKEKRRRAAIKHQKALEAEQLRREKEPKKRKGWSQSRVLGIGFLVLVILVIGVYAAWQSAQPPSNNRQLAPLFTLTDIDGNTVALENLTGKVVILNFFDTHCPPCVAEVPYLKEFDEQHSNANLVILSIDVDPYYDTVELLRQFRDNNQITWSILVGTTSVADDYSISATPTTLLVDRQGFIYKTHIGWDVNSSPSELSTEIEYLLSS